MQRLGQQPNKLKHIWMWLAVRFEIADYLLQESREKYVTREQSRKMMVAEVLGKNNATSTK